MTFFAVWAKPRGDRATAKILERKLLPPYVDCRVGLDRSNLAGVDRLDEAVFRGEYPFAFLSFRDAALPVRVGLEAFNPFIPLNVADSSIPVAIFNWTFQNPLSKPVSISLLASMTNPVGWQDIGVETEPFPERLNQFRDDGSVRGLWFTAPELPEEDPNFGTAALVTGWEKVDVQTRMDRGGRWDNAHLLWDDFSADGRLESRIESEYQDGVKPSGGTTAEESGAIVLRATLPPKGKAVLPVMISWHFPHFKAWTEGTVVRTYTGKLFRDAWDAAGYAARHMERLTEETTRWHGTIFGSSLPAHVLDAVTSQASIIRTNTCIRLADGQFYGWEGCHDDVGCCEGTCTHVWKYAQALAFLFPELERSIRRNEFLNSLDNDGHMSYRSGMPANVHARTANPAGDGQMGAVVRAYRDWQLSGDDAFLRQIWPGVKRALEYAWTASSGWDPDKDGVMEGCQHNTYDIEFYGPNSMMGSVYLGALRAAEEMARYLGEAEKAREYRGIFESGRQGIEDLLWNGEYYIQRVEVMPGLSVPEPLRGPAPWGEDCVCDDPPETQAADGEYELKYQYGEGCLSDQLIGQWAARVVGLGDLLDPLHVRGAVESIFRYNFRKPIDEVDNVQRVYALNEEAGLLVCSWPRGNRPRLPFFYCDEVWTGIEYQVAAHLIYEGLIAEGLAVVKGARDRHDGLRRNPWDEIECGHHYARAMSSWSLLLALCGYHYSAVEKRIRFAPKIYQDDFRCAFTTASGWGTLSQRIGKVRQRIGVKVDYGRVYLRSIVLQGDGVKASARLDVKPIGVSCRTVEQGIVEVVLEEEVEVGAGGKLNITISEK